MISIIIPTLNEEAAIEATLRGIAGLEGQNQRKGRSPSGPYGTVDQSLHNPAGAAAEGGDEQAIHNSAGTAAGQSLHNPTGAAPEGQEGQAIHSSTETVAGRADRLEIIVVDGGSRDRTREIASRYARVIQTRPPEVDTLPVAHPDEQQRGSLSTAAAGRQTGRPSIASTGRGAGKLPVAPAGRRRGRAVQMNTGAGHASGDILLFLHADTRLPQGISLVEKISEALEQPGVIAGSFALRFDHPHPFLRFLTFFTRFSWWWARYGDQGLFLRRETFEELGGFREIPIMEDVDIIRRLRRLGGLYIIQEPVVTSARRYLGRGIYRQHLLNVFLFVAYFCGVPPDKLKRWYDDAR